MLYPLPGMLLFLYPFLSVLHLCHLHMMTMKTPTLISPRTFSKSHSEQQTNALNQFPLVQIWCSFPVFLSHQFLIVSGKRFIFLINTIVLKIYTLLPLEFLLLFPLLIMNEFSLISYLFQIRSQKADK